ncbi:major facilitator superfamily domain-containing protein [Aspergillus pseudonomiae]|uniref:Major facilitator superfamily domain-containing protein n=1 Tax=Aspergillus pseudonomiae TaxID=1506151 RepID=A0A5N7D7L5_9EURO|nr:major facilitator superfamily domain-containing protein [Aspergillus pseudonomiae]KAE8402195.1 major facilitator superfamily domain-containing protein [Aspergillus pseudonomiae]
MSGGVLNSDKPPSSSDSSGTAVVETDGETKTPHVFNEQTNYVPKSTIITIFLACSTVDLIALMDQTTLASSLSIIGNALDASDKASWISGGYFVTSTCFQLIYGRLSDIWSRKLVLFVGLGIFFIGSLAASLSQTATQLIVFRAFTGVGGGGLMTVAQMIVSDVVPLRERGKYQGILGAVVAIANGIGPVIGGALSSINEDSWRWIFRLNLPLTAITTLCVLFFMPLRKVTGDWKMKLKAIDFVGAFLALGSTAVLLLGLTWGGGEYPWASAHVIATIVVGFAVAVGFVLWQWKGATYPLVPMHIFKSRIVNGACLTMFINGWNFLVQVYYIPTFYQLVFGYSTVKAGAMLLPVTLMQTVSSTVSGLVVHWVGRYRECILFGWMIWAIGLGLFSTLDQSSGLGKQIGYGLLTGAGVGNTLQPALIAVQAGVERKDMAVVTSFRNFVRNLGGTLGLAIAGTIINNLITSSISSLGLTQSETRSFLSSPQNYLSKLPQEEAEHARSLLIPAYRKGFRIIFLIGAALAAFAFVLAFWLMPQVSLNRADDEKLKEEGRKRVKGERSSDEEVVGEERRS